jgi:MFS family permease
MSTSRSAGSRGLFSSQSDFFRLWLVGCSAFVVRWLEMLAVGLYAYQITSSAFIVAMLSMLRLLPMGLFGAVLGAVSDRVDRRSAIIVMVVVSMLGTGSLAVLASFDAVEVWHLALASFVNGICWAADNPFRRMTIGEVVGPERMGKAMAIDAGTNNASRVVGPLVSGLLLGHLGIASVFWLGVALYVPSLWAALRLRVRSAKSRETRKEGIGTSIAQGFRWLRGDDRVIGVFVITVYFNVFGWPCSSMIPVIGTDYMRLDESAIGMMASADGVGGLIGALLVGTLVKLHWQGRVYAAAVAVYFTTLIAFAYAPNGIAGALALLCTGTLGASFAIMQSTLVYRYTPPVMRARLLGLLSMCIGTSPIGFFYLGWLAQVLGPRNGVVALAAQGVLAMLLTRRWWKAALTG